MEGYMESSRVSDEYGNLKTWHAVCLVISAGVSFQLAYSFPACGFFFAVYLWCLFQLTRLKTARLASYFGLAAGLVTFAPQLYFFWTLFGPAAIALWAICAFWIRMFIVLGRACRRQFGEKWTALLIPFVWTGFEYFRSELYYLRFSWLNAGYVFANTLHWLPMRELGMYGFGFTIMLLIGLTDLLPRKTSCQALVASLGILAILNNLPAPKGVADKTVGNTVAVAGVQMEFPSEPEIMLNLNKLARAHPEAQILVLSEYTLDGPVTPRLKTWCVENHRYLVLGGKAPAQKGDYYDTVFVVAPTGEEVFQQGKCVPVQFFKDGLPAKEQALWDSPWGKIGFCICYDLSYSRVTDELVRLGAQALIVPTMDVVDWGRHQHELHARVAPVRAAEYGLPIFRVGSSGISQCVNRDGEVTATAPMPGDGAMISGSLELNKAGALPVDRIIAPISVGLTGALIIWFTFCWVRTQLNRKQAPATA